MRVVLVGRPNDRERLRWALAGTALEIAGEAATIAEARRDGIDAEAFLVAAAPAADPLDGDPIEPLTPREREVLALMATGLANKGIAAALGISDQTVKFHVASIAGKLGAANRTDAVRRAIERGLVPI